VEEDEHQADASTFVGESVGITGAVRHQKLAAWHARHFLCNVQRWIQGALAGLS
jgi:hypothetical protein